MMPQAYQPLVDRWLNIVNAAQQEPDLDLDGPLDDDIPEDDSRPK